MFITAHLQHYPPDLFPCFWKQLARWGKQRRIVSCAAVLEELGGRKDELRAWAAKNAVIFPQPDLAVAHAYEQIVNLVSSLYEPQHVYTFLAGADPWVIAQAAAHDLVVVTMETARQEQVDKKTQKISGRIKQPNVCARFNVRTADVLFMLRALDFRC